MDGATRPISMIALEGLLPPQSCHAVGQPPDPDTLSSRGGSGISAPASAPRVFPPVLGPPPTILDIALFSGCGLEFSSVLGCHATGV